MYAPPVRIVSRLAAMQFQVQDEAVCRTEESRLFKLVKRTVLTHTEVHRFIITEVHRFIYTIDEAHRF